MYGDWTVFLKKKKHSIFRGMVGLIYIVLFLYRKIKKFIDSWNRGSGTVHAVPYLTLKGTIVWDGIIWSFKLIWGKKQRFQIFWFWSNIDGSVYFSGFFCCLAYSPYTQRTLIKGSDQWKIRWDEKVANGWHWSETVVIDFLLSFNLAAILD